MATIKNHTDLKQSNILKEILPTESADLHWQYVEEDSRQLQWFCLPKDFSINQYNSVPAWSVTALLEIIRKSTAVDLLIDGRGCRCHCRDKYEGKFYGTDDYCDNPIDACYEIIIKLYEFKLL